MALAAGLKNYIMGVPKAELHIHIEGTLEPELMFSLGGRNRVSLQGDVNSTRKRRENFQVLGYHAYMWSENNPTDSLNYACNKWWVGHAPFS